MKWLQIRTKDKEWENVVEVPSSERINEFVIGFLKVKGNYIDRKVGNRYEVTSEIGEPAEYRVVDEIGELLTNNDNLVVLLSHDLQLDGQKMIGQGLDGKWYVWSKLTYKDAEEHTFPDENSAREKYESIKLPYTTIRYSPIQTPVLMRRSSTLALLDRNKATPTTTPWPAPRQWEKLTTESSCY